MTKRERFENRVHNVAHTILSTGAYSPESIASAAVQYVQAVEAALAEVPHTEEPAPAPLAWRPMSEIEEAAGDIAVVFESGRRVVSGIYDARAYAREAIEDCDLAWLQLPPLPTSKL